MTTDLLLVAFTALLALFTLALAAVGVLQWQTLAATLSTSQEIERAYVTLSHEPPGLQKDGFGRFRVTMTIKNAGHTPADILGGRVATATRPLGGHLLKMRAVTPIPPAYITADDDAGLFLHRFPVQITPEELFNDSAWLIAQLDYRDRFGRLHQAGYGRRYNPRISSDNLVFDDSITGFNYDRPLTNAEAAQYDRRQPRLLVRWLHVLAQAARRDIYALVYGPPGEDRGTPQPPSIHPPDEAAPTG